MAEAAAKLSTMIFPFKVEKINPLFVTYERGQIEGVKYPQLTAVLVNAVKELKADDILRAGLKAANDKEAAEIAAPRP